MKKKQNLFLGFAVMVIITISTMAGCISTMAEYAEKEDVTLPSGFIGTWKRADQLYPTTLIFTSKTRKASNQNGYWNITGISGDAYTWAWYNDPTWSFTTIYKLVNGNLEISGDPGTGEDNWNGIWIKQ
jgi:hypothetical protein